MVLGEMGSRNAGFSSGYRSIFYLPGASLKEYAAF